LEFLSLIYGRFLAKRRGRAFATRFLHLQKAQLQKSSNKGSIANAIDSDLKKE